MANYRMTKADEKAYRIRYCGEQVGWCREIPNGKGGTCWHAQTPQGQAMGRDVMECFANFTRTVPTPKPVKVTKLWTAGNAVARGKPPQTARGTIINGTRPHDAPIAGLTDLGTLPFRLVERHVA